MRKQGRDGLCLVEHLGIEMWILTYRTVMTKIVINISAAKEAVRLHSDSTAKYHIILKLKHTSSFILILAELDLI